MRLKHSKKSREMTIRGIYVAMESWRDALDKGQLAQVEFDKYMEMANLSLIRLGVER